MARRSGGHWGGAAYNLAASYDALRADYNLAKSSRFRRRRAGVSSTGTTSDWHFRSEADFLRMIELARDIDRNDIVVGQGVNRVVDNVVQDGMRFDYQTGDGELNKRLNATLAEWATDADLCDVAGERDFADMQRAGLRDTIVDGDITFLGLVEGQLQAAEAHRVRTPTNTKRNVVHGVLLDPFRKRLEYWITKDDIDPNTRLQRVEDVQRYPVRDELGTRQIFHVYDPKRTSQTRGITALAPIGDAVGMHDDVQFARLVQQQLVSCFGFIRERTDAFAGGSAPAFGDQTAETSAAGSIRTIEGISPGLEITSAIGEQIKAFAPNVPNPEFFPHAMMILTFIAVNLGVPVQLLLLDPKQTNFSGWRGAMDQARIGFRHQQRDVVIKRLCAPVGRWKTAQFIADDATIRRLASKPGIRPFNIVWTPPGWKYIEPFKDAQADALIVERRLTSPRRSYGGRALDIDVIREEIIEDNAAFIRGAILEAQAIQTDTGVTVDWHELLHITHPGQLTLTAEVDDVDDTGPGNDDDGTPAPAPAPANDNARSAPASGSGRDSTTPAARRAATPAARHSTAAAEPLNAGGND